MSTKINDAYGLNVIANGRNFNAIRLLTGKTTGVKGHILRQVNFHFKDNSILIILKKDSPKGPMVAFMEAESLDDALWVVACAIKHKRIPWKPDKWRTTRSDEK